ncbi:hypothetical protein BVC80_9081g40 [Macleaya cordata]|uniref:RNase H type-1 domain-containing protein n=1 Tax=Macleaya cordata TaxID=56857 RepID=A0A200PRQ8_MACCD|nr:hypothetical protein BVC80_9081g40 [Macleaya cordata]
MVLAKSFRRILRSESRLPSQVLQTIRLEVRLRASMFDAPLADSDYNRQFMDRWGLNARFQVPQMITCYWLKPSPGFVMINTDGSLNDGAAGFGAIIRIEEGDALTAVAGSSVPKTITYHEL